jgi:hypothetical protein
MTTHTKSHSVDIDRFEIENVVYSILTAALGMALAAAFIALSL